MQNNANDSLRCHNYMTYAGLLTVWFQYVQYLSAVVAGTYPYHHGRYCMGLGRCDSVKAHE